jgi:hypothetical protein
MTNLKFIDCDEDGIVGDAYAGKKYAECATECMRKSSLTNRKVTMRWNGTTTVWYPSNEKDDNLWKKWNI